MKYENIVMTDANSGIDKYTYEKLITLDFTVFAGVRKAVDGISIKELNCVPVIFDMTSEKVVVSVEKEVHDKMQ